MTWLMSRAARRVIACNAASAMRTRVRRPSFGSVAASTSPRALRRDTARRDDYDHRAGSGLQGCNSVRKTLMPTPAAAVTMTAAERTTLKKCASARRPRPELAGVADSPDAADPVAGEVERDHRHDDAVQLGHQAGLAVDRALQDRQAGYPAGEIEGIARDLLGALDRADRGADQATAVGDRGCAGVEQADEGADVPGFPGLLEGPDDAGALGYGGRGRLGCADAAAGRGGQLAGCLRRPADDAGHVREGVAEDVVEDERDPLGRGHRVEHDQEGHADRLVQRDPVGRVAAPPAWPTADPLRLFGQRLGQPLTNVVFSPG